MKTFRYRYALYGTAIALAYCLLFFALHRASSARPPGDPPGEFPATAALVLLSLPLCLLGGYLLGAERDRREGAQRLVERYRAEVEAAGELAASLARNEEAKRMMAIAVRELKHPLTSIVGFVLTLREYWDKLEEESKLEFMQYLNVSSSRLVGIANYLSRILEMPESIAWKPKEALELEEMLAEASSMLEDIYAERKVRIAVRFMRGAPPLRGDPSLLFDLIYNLLDICVRCSESGGMVSAWGSTRDSGATLHLRCHHASIGAERIAAIREWPPADSGGETATLSMQYRLACGMTEEIGGDLRLEVVGEHGISFLIALPRG